MTIFGFALLGPPGSGKSSFCAEVVKLMRSLGRKVQLIDLDPANENQPYKSDVCIGELIKVEEVMEEFSLGFNGALMYSMQYLEKNLEWLTDKFKAMESGTFLVFDLPGQVELFIHNTALKKIFKEFEKQDIQMCSVYLVDSHCCTDPGKFISFLITTLMSMVHIELPRVNLLSKIDLIPKHEGKLAFGLDFYTEVLDLDRLVALLDKDPITGRYKKLTKALADVVERYGLVKFTPLSLSDKESLILALKLIDCAIGYSVSGEDNLIASFIQEDKDIKDLTAMLNEKYVFPKKAEIPVNLVGSIKERNEDGTLTD